MIMSKWGKNKNTTHRCSYLNFDAFWDLPLKMHPTMESTYFIYFFISIFLFYDKENLFDNQELFLLVIISSILVTFMLDSGVIL